MIFLSLRRFLLFKKLSTYHKKYRRTDTSYQSIKHRIIDFSIKLISVKYIFLNFYNSVMRIAQIPRSVISVARLPTKHAKKSASSTPGTRSIVYEIASNCVVPLARRESSGVIPGKFHPLFDHLLASFFLRTISERSIIADRRVLLGWVSQRRVLVVLETFFGQVSLYPTTKWKWRRSNR